MAEKLPGLIDPNLPPDQQPLNDTSNPNPVSHPPQALHPDRFTPGSAVTPNVTASPTSGQDLSPRGTPTQSAPPKKTPTTTPPSGNSTANAPDSTTPAAHAAEEPLAMSVLTADSRREIEIHRYPVLIYALVPAGALVLQAWLPRVLGRFAWFDLPLVVTVFFALEPAQSDPGFDHWAASWASLKMR